MFDLIILGGGTTGLKAASEAAFLGKSVAVIENNIIGGTCLNRGCIPSKLLIHGAEILKTLEHAKDFGIDLRTKISFEKAMNHQRSIIKTAQENAELNLKQDKNIEIIKGSAKLIDANTVEILGINSNQPIQRIRAKFILIALGGNPVTPQIKGLEQIKSIDSNSVWALKKQPKHLIMLGGGYVSIELAFFFAMYGTKVTIINRGDRILGREDSEVATYIEESLKKIGVKILANEEIKSIEKIQNKKGKTKDQNKYVFTLNNTKIKADSLMINVGRKPNTKGIGLEEAGLRLENGFVKVNDYLQTLIPNIYAIGDVNGRSAFAHTGKYEAEIAINNMFNSKKDAKYFVPYAVFTYPQIGAVGMSEDELKEKKIKYTKYFAENRNNGKHKIIGETEGFVKAMFDMNGKLLGARVVGESASEIIHEFVVLINSEGNHLETLKRSIHIHPTLSESIRNLF